MRFFLVLGFYLCSTMGALACAAPDAREFSCASTAFHACEIIVKGAPRHYCKHVPDQGGDLPALMAFHGAGADANAMVNLWRGYTEQGLILIIPDAKETGSDGTCSTIWRQIGFQAQNWEEMAKPYGCAGGDGYSDLDFIQALMAEVEVGAKIQGWYATGFSAGAGFVYQLYLTLPIATRFKGFAAVGMGMSRAKEAAVQDGAQKVIGHVFSPNFDSKRPFLFHMGTSDKFAYPIENVAIALRDHPRCAKPPSIFMALRCVLFNQTENGRGTFDMTSQIDLTERWLADFNRTQPRRIESLYPDLGAGEGGDKTMTVRADYLPLSDGAPVAVLTAVGGGHDWPGWGGNHAPCTSGMCDIDLAREILQFFRATAGMVTPPR